MLAAAAELHGDQAMPHMQARQQNVPLQCIRVPDNPSARYHSCMASSPRLASAAINQRPRASSACHPATACSPDNLPPAAPLINPHRSKTSAFRTCHCQPPTCCARQLLQHKARPLPAAGSGPAAALLQPLQHWPVPDDGLAKGQPGLVPLLLGTTTPLLHTSPSPAT
jgi:hypothetical protein